MLTHGSVRRPPVHGGQSQVTRSSGSSAFAVREGSGHGAAPRPGAHCPRRLRLERALRRGPPARGARPRRPSPASWRARQSWVGPRRCQVPVAPAQDRRASPGTPEREPGRFEVAVEAEHLPAAGGLHHGEAHGVRVRDGTRRQSLQPAAGRGVILAGRESDAHAWARLQSLQRSPRGPHPEPEEDEPVHLGKDEIGRDERRLTADGLPECVLRLGVMLVAPAQQREPAPAIDEEPSGDVVAAARGTGPAVRQRRSRRDTDRSSR